MRAEEAPGRSGRGAGPVARAAAAHASVSGPLAAPPAVRRAAVPCSLGLGSVFPAVLPDCVGGCLQLYVMSLDFISGASV